MHLNLGNVSPKAQLFIDEEGSQVSPFIIFNSNFLNQHRNVSAMSDSFQSQICFLLILENLARPSFLRIGCHLKIEVKAIVCETSTHKDYTMNENVLIPKKKRNT